MEIKNGVISTNGITDVSGDVTLIKGYTDTEVAAIKVETDKIPAEVVKTASLELKTTLASKNLASNTSIAHVIGNKEDDEDGTSLYAKAYVANRHTHSRNYTYPYKAAAIVVTGGAGAWAEGAKTEIIPTATNDIQTFTITHAADAPGTVDIVLDDIVYSKTVPAGTINEVAAFLRSETYCNNHGDCTWTVTGADADVIFTHLGKHITGTFLDVGAVTGVTATIVHTNVGVGVGKDFDLHFFTPSAPSATTTYQVIFWSGLAGRESRISTKRLVKATAQDTLEPVALQSPLLASGTRISASLATLAGTSDTIALAVDYHNY